MVAVGSGGVGESCGMSDWDAKYVPTKSAKIRKPSAGPNHHFFVISTRKSMSERDVSGAWHRTWPFRAR